MKSKRIDISECRRCPHHKGEITIVVNGKSEPHKISCSQIRLYMDMPKVIAKKVKGCLCATH
jgi:hypothetical protein